MGREQRLEAGRQQRPPFHSRAAAIAEGRLCTLPRGAGVPGGAPRLPKTRSWRVKSDLETCFLLSAVVFAILFLKQFSPQPHTRRERLFPCPLGQGTREARYARDRGKLRLTGATKWRQLMRIVTEAVVRTLTAVGGMVLIFSVLVSNFTFFDCVFCLFVLRTTEVFSSLLFPLQKKGRKNAADRVGNRWQAVPRLLS